jgi:hypothetical protein
MGEEGIATDAPVKDTPSCDRKGRMEGGVKEITPNMREGVENDNTGRDGTLGGTLLAGGTGAPGGKVEPVGGSVVGKGRRVEVVVIRDVTELCQGCSSGFSSAPPVLLEAGEAQFGELSISGSGGGGSCMGGVDGPELWPYGPDLGIARHVGRGEAVDLEGSLPGEEAAGGLDCHVNQGDCILPIPKGQAPYRRVQLHVGVDTDEPGLLQDVPLIRGELLLLLCKVPLPLKPRLLRPGTVDDEGRAGVGDGNKVACVFKGLEAARREELPKEEHPVGAVVHVRA